MIVLFLFFWQNLSCKYILHIVDNATNQMAFNKLFCSIYLQRTKLYSLLHLYHIYFFLITRKWKLLHGRKKEPMDKDCQITVYDWKLCKGPNTHIHTPPLPLRKVFPPRCLSSTSAPAPSHASPFRPRYLVFK